MRLDKLVKIEIGPKTKAIIEDTVAICPDNSYRKGVPNGKPSHFSRDKMRCACYVALGIPGITISGMTGVGYGTVRTWKMEERFKKMVRTIKDYFKTEEIQRRVVTRRSSAERRKLKVYGR